MLAEKVETDHQIHHNYLLFIFIKNMISGATSLSVMKISLTKRTWPTS